MKGSVCSFRRSLFRGAEWSSIALTLGAVFSIIARAFQENFFPHEIPCFVSNKVQYSHTISESVEGGAMKYVGFLFGMENTFPGAVVAKINEMNSGVIAEFVDLGVTTMAAPVKYDVIVDRISQDSSRMR
jgi:hypothetical protein